MSNSIETVIERLAGDIPGAYAYVFDGELERFIYRSQENTSLEETIIKLNKEKGLAQLVSDTPNNLLMLDCSDTNRKFLVKKLAADLYFGLCVEQNPEIIEKARFVMDTSFT